MLKSEVDALLKTRKRQRWHYESRIKELQSFALKVESGRGFRDGTLEDFFACTLVVETPASLAAAESLVRENFAIEERRPASDVETTVQPETFRFEDVRLYARTVALNDLRPRGFEGRVFEIQLKTFCSTPGPLRHMILSIKAKTEDGDAVALRFKVKAMLEQAETAIGAAAIRDVVALVDRPYGRYREISDVVLALEERWPDEGLPKDRTTLAENIIGLMRALRMEAAAFFELVDDATNDGRGASSRNLSPFAACVQSLIDKKRDQLFRYLQGERQRRDFVVVLPRELELPLAWRDADMPRARQLS